MPPFVATHLRLPETLRAQDYVIHRRQALRFGLTRGALDRRLGSGAWQRLLPQVYVVGPGEPSRRQLLVAGLLFAGSAAAIDDVDACHFHGVRAVPVEPQTVFVAVPESAAARSRGFVVVRRSSTPLHVVRTERLRYVAPAAAAVAAARRLDSDRAVLALFSDVVQRRIATFDELMTAHIQGPPRNARRADRALHAIGAGIRSAPEADFRRLAEASLVLPSLLYNPLLRLPSGRLVSPDALAADAALVHETNGALAHKRADLFDDMQERHDAMTEAGLTVLHNAPRRLQLSGREVIAQFERCYLRLRGTGLPPGVELVSIAA